MLVFCYARMGVLVMLCACCGSWTAEFQCAPHHFGTVGGTVLKCTSPAPVACSVARAASHAMERQVDFTQELEALSPSERELVASAKRVLREWGSSYAQVRGLFLAAIACRLVPSPHRWRLPLQPAGGEGVEGCYGTLSVPSMERIMLVLWAVGALDGGLCDIGAGLGG